MRIADHGKQFDNSLSDAVEGFFNLLEKHQFEVIVSQDLQPFLQQFGFAKNRGPGP